jgi:MYXO-CTERM domain-containing protein
MLRKAFLAIALVASLSASALAEVTIVAGDHVAPAGGLFTFPIMGVSDSGEQLNGVVLNLVMEPNGSNLAPIVTNVNLITGTVFEGNNLGQSDYGDPEFLTPGRTPSYYTGTPSGFVPTGIVALVTVDTTGIAPGTYELNLVSPIFGPSSVSAGPEPGGYMNGTITVVPEPGSVVLGLFAAAGLGAVVIRRRRARNA